jgi:hypothetical protein
LILRILANVLTWCLQRIVFHIVQIWVRRILNFYFLKWYLSWLVFHRGWQRWESIPILIG